MATTARHPAQNASSRLTLILWPASTRWTDWCTLGNEHLPNMDELLRRSAGDAVISARETR